MQYKSSNKNQGGRRYMEDVVCLQNAGEESLFSNVIGDSNYIRQWQKNGERGPSMQV